MRKVFVFTMFLLILAACDTRNWHVTHSWQGQGTEHSDIFTVSSDWKITYNCGQTELVGGATYNVQVAVYSHPVTDNTGNLSGDDAGIAIDAVCRSSSDSGSVVETQRGDFYLVVRSEGSYTITVSEPS